MLASALKVIPAKWWTTLGVHIAGAQTLATTVLHLQEFVVCQEQQEAIQ